MNPQKFIWVCRVTVGVADICKPADLGKTYRGVSLTYYAAKIWAEGGITSRVIPPTADDTVACLLGRLRSGTVYAPQVYDYAEGGDATSREAPINRGNSQNQPTILNLPQKTQRRSLAQSILTDGVPIIIQRVVIGNGMITLSSETVHRPTILLFRNREFMMLPVRICFPYWDKNGINISLDGSRLDFTKRLWWPYGEAPSGRLLPAGEACRQENTPSPLMAV